jgi:hypothetical protein
MGEEDSTAGVENIFGANRQHSGCAFLFAWCNVVMWKQCCHVHALNVEIPSHSSWLVARRW